MYPAAMRMALKTNRMMMMSVRMISQYIKFRWLRDTCRRRVAASTKRNAASTPQGNWMRRNGQLLQPHQNGSSTAGALSPRESRKTLVPPKLIFNASARGAPRSSKPHFQRSTPTEQGKMAKSSFAERPSHKTSHKNMAQDAKHRTQSLELKRARDRSPKLYLFPAPLTAPSFGDSRPASALETRSTCLLRFDFRAVRRLI